MADVVVVGGGAIGLASAWELALAGADVVCCDPDPARGASWAAAGMLAPVTEVTYGEDALLRLNLAGRARWPDFAARLERATGATIGYHESGALSVARDVDDRAELVRLHRYQRDLGLDVELLRAREARRLEPALAPGIRGAVDCPGDGQVDNRAYVEALQDAGHHAGVTYLPRRVTGVRRRGDAVRGVAFDDGTTLDAPRVVVAAGEGTTALASVAGTDGTTPDGRASLPPVRPVKGQLLHLRADRAEAPLCERVIRGLAVYVVPRADGRVVVGATVEERGRDRRATAGGVHDLLRDATELLPGIRELELVEVTVGLRPALPDNAPAIGPSELEGLVVATGHWRNGVLLSPITAEAVAALAAGRPPPPEVSAFGPERFSRTAPTAADGSPAAPEPCGSAPAASLPGQSGVPPTPRQESGGKASP